MADIVQILEEIGTAEMQGKPVGDQVEALLKKQESPADVQEILNALPPSVARTHFLSILENKDTKNRAEIAKAYTSVITEVSFSDPRKAYLVMYDALSTNPAYQAEAHTFLVKYLQTFSQVAELTGLADTEAKAVAAIINSLKLPVWQFDEVLDALPVRALAASQNSESKACRELFLSFTQNCSYSAFQKVLTQHGDLIKNKWGLNEDDLKEKIRLILLCKLVHDNPGEVVSYKAITSSLNIEEGQVEEFVVKAISKKLLIAKIDQVAKHITVSYAHHSMFGVDQWRQLKDTLDHWQVQLNKIAGQSNF